MITYQNWLRQFFLFDNSLNVAFNCSFQDTTGRVNIPD